MPKSEAMRQFYCYLVLESLGIYIVRIVILPQLRLPRAHPPQPAGMVAVNVPARSRRMTHLLNIS
jgi:hypothetical protein